jgi:IclR family transcriptional regulator, acetate operon repressor
MSQLRKALDVVQLVALRRELTVREIGEAMRLPKSTAHRLVANLVDVRLLEAHPGPDGDVFALGTLTHDLTGGQTSWRTLAQHARAEMQAVRDQTGETVGLHILFGDRRLLVDQAVSRHEHRWVYNNQMVPMPMYAGAAAKMLLATLPDSEMHRLAGRDHTQAVAKGRRGRNLDDFLVELREIRRRGFSSTSDEVNPGIASIAVPIADTGGGYPPAALSLAGPSVRFTDKAVKRSLLKLRQAAKTVAANLRPSADSPASGDQTGWSTRKSVSVVETGVER